MGAGKKKAAKAKAKAKQIKKMKKTWMADDASQKLKKCQDELDWFEECFPDEKQCKQQLIYWLGWKLSKTNAVFNCPKCGGTEARTSWKQEGKQKKKRLVFRCGNTKCKSTPSPKSVTMMAGSHAPYRFWYLCIYVIGLMNGEVPWAYLNRQRVNFKSGKKKKTIQMRDMSNIIYTILNECSDIDKRMNYCRLVGTESFDHETFGSYSSWYKSDSWLYWRVTFQRRRLSNKSLKKVITSEKYEDGVLSVCRLKTRIVEEGDWLLVAQISNENKLYNIKWMYVSCVEMIDKKKSKSYKDGYRYVAIQKNDDPTEDHPFKIDTKFKNAFKSSFSKKELSAIDSGSVESQTAAALKKIYDNSRHIKS